MDYVANCIYNTFKENRLFLTSYIYIAHLLINMPKLCIKLVCTISNGRIVSGIQNNSCRKYVV